MNRPPRASAAALFSPALMLWSLLQGTVALLPLALTYGLALRRGLPEGDARALTFVSLVLVDLGLVLVNRGFGAAVIRALGKANQALLWVSGATLTTLTFVLLWPVSRELFRFGPLHADDMMLVLLIVAGVVATLEFLKRFWKTRLTA